MNRFTTVYLSLPPVCIKSVGFHLGLLGRHTIRSSHSHPFASWMCLPMSRFWADSAPTLRLIACCPNCQDPCFQKKIAGFLFIIVTALPFIGVAICSLVRYLFCAVYTCLSLLFTFLPTSYRSFRVSLLTHCCQNFRQACPS